MNSKLKQAVIDQALTDIGALLTEHIDKIDETMNDMLIESSGETKFKYSVGCKIILQPMGSSVCGQKASISYSSRQKAETEVVFTNPAQQELDFAEHVIT